MKFVGYAFQIEMKYTTIKHGFKVKEIPIIFTDRTAGTSKMSSGIFKEAFFGVHPDEDQQHFQEVSGGIDLRLVM
jgi:dolichol-phosphate mannosyltransferase